MSDLPVDYERETTVVEDVARAFNGGELKIPAERIQDGAALRMVARHAYRIGRVTTEIDNPVACVGESIQKRGELFKRAYEGVTEDVLTKSLIAGAFVKGIEDAKLIAEDQNG